MRRISSSVIFCTSSRARFIVFADLFVFGKLLQRVIAIAAYVADRGAMLFENLVEVLHDVAAALFGHGRNRNANDLAVRDWIEAEIGSLDGLLDLLENRRIPGLDENSLGSGAPTCAIWLMGVMVP